MTDLVFQVPLQLLLVHLLAVIQCHIRRGRVRVASLSNRIDDANFLARQGSLADIPLLQPVPILVHSVNHHVLAKPAPSIV